MSLARLWHERGQTKDAHELLTPIYGRLTESFGTADLQAARALLDTLLAAQLTPLPGLP